MTSSPRPAFCISLLIELLVIGACSPAGEQSSRSVDLRIGVPVPAVRTRGSGIPNLIESLTAESLVLNAVDGRPTERLAKQWSWNADHTVLHVELQEGVVFHDGTPLTPELVAESLRQDVANQTGLALGTVKKIETWAKGIDIVLPSPDAFLLEDLGLTTIRRPGKPEISTGPFKVITQGPVVKLDAWDRYYKGKPSIRSITISSYPTQRNAWAALLRSEIDMLQEVSPDASDFVEAESAVRAYSFPKSYYYLLAFNLHNPVLSKAVVRRAINEAVDKQAIVADGLHGRARPAAGPVWPEFWTASDTVPGSKFDRESAERRLEEAGYPMRPGDSSHGPSRIRLRCLVWADDTRLVRTALLLQKQLSAVGIDISLEALSVTQFLPRLSKGDFDMFLFEMANARTLNFVYLFWHSPQEQLQTFNYTGYTAADSTLDAIRRAASDEEIRKRTLELQRIFVDDPPAVFLAWETTTRAVSAEFSVPNEPGRDILSSIWRWKPASPGQLAER
jgi:peptide/nickel transport system substrate-binding protein